jgi:AraC-like DNA-binding protein
VFNLCDGEIRIYDRAHHDRYTRYSGAVVSGAYSSFFVIDPLVHTSIIGVHFRPGGAFPFLRLPADELADTHVDLADLWGPLADQLHERLRAATPAQRFSVLEAALFSRLDHPPQRHDAVSVALNTFDQTGGEVRIRDIARRVGLSQRRFIQVFAAEIGLTPKLYGRIRRFHQARQLVRNADAPDWARVAAECGYFDQSHLIRDFCAFSGLSPMAYLNQRSDDVLPHHIPQAGGGQFFPIQTPHPGAS